MKRAATGPTMGRAARPVRRILLIYPPMRVHREGIKQSLPPLGVASLAAVVRDRCDVAILDAAAEGFAQERSSDHGFFIFGLSPTEIARRIRQYDPDLVGITCPFSSTFPVVAELCAISKTVAPRALTVAGGTHVSYLAEQCLQETPDLDLIALGEGEPVLAALLDALADGSDLATVDGLAYRDPLTGRPRVNPKTRFVKDLDSLPLPARDLLPMRLYERIGVPHNLVRDRRRYTTVFTSRGCPARCTFCSSWSFWGGRYRARSAEMVLDELETLVRDHGIEEVHFEDDNVSANPKRWRRILEGMVERDLGLRWCTPNGVALWTLDPQTVQLMKAAGCYEVTLAFESGDQGVIDAIIGKPLKLNEAQPILAALRRAGIRVNGFFMIGMPGETLAQIRRTLRTPAELGLSFAWIFVANPLPGTELYEICAREGYLRDGFDFVNNSFSRCNIETPQWTSRQVERLAHRAFLRNNLLGVVRRPWEYWNMYRGLLANPSAMTQAVRGLALRNMPWRMST